MRDSVREALFNILSTTVVDSLGWDLFAGTGALGIEAISRGAHRCIAIDNDRKSTETIRQTAANLRIETQIEVITGDAFRLADRLFDSGDTSRPWVVFVCPPFEFWDRFQEQLVALIGLALEKSPPASQIVVELSEFADPACLPSAEWDLRKYGCSQLAFAGEG
jgi:16S rRNA (guanine966-N2)-methyltransferase